MNKNLKIDSNNWTLITIDDPAFLPGESIFDIIQLIIKEIEFKFVIPDEIYGAGVGPLFKKENSILVIEEFLNLLSGVKQFDWGDLFLFKEYPKNWDNPGDGDYPYLIAQTETTVRAVDDQYIYIYTPYKEIVDVIKANYEIESIKNGPLESLDYPY